jgi:hypothetical protein
LAAHSGKKFLAIILNNDAILINLNILISPSPFKLLVMKKYIPKTTKNASATFHLSAKKF